MRRSSDEGGGEAGGTRPSRSGRDRTPLPPGFSAVWTCVAIDLVGFGIVLPILPLYARRFGASATAIGLLVASFSLAQLLFAPVLGRLSDRIGRKPVLILSLTGTAVASLVTGLAGTLWLLFAARIADGISGASVSVAQATVIDMATPEERSRLLGLLGAAFGLGFVAGPILGGLAALVDPRLPFFLAALIAGVNAVVASRRLPETNPSPGEAVAGGAPDPEGADGGGEGAGVGAYALIAFVALAAFSAFEATFALFGNRRLGFGEASTAAVFAGVGILIALVQIGLVRPCVRRLGERGALRCGLLVNAAGLLILAAVQSRVALVPALVLLTVGQGLVTPTLSALVGGGVGARKRGGALGIQQAAGGLGRVAGPVAGGVLFQHVGTASPFVGGAVLMAVAALLVSQA